MNFHSVCDKNIKEEIKYEVDEEFVEIFEEDKKVKDYIDNTLQTELLDVSHGKC